MTWFRLAARWNKPIGTHAATALATMVGLAASHASAGTIRSVPSQFASVQDAIEASADGDSVVIAPGIYYETFSMMGKAVTVRSLDPEDPAIVAATIVSRNGSESVVSCTQNEGPGCVIAGLTLTGADYPGAIYCEFSGPTIYRCRLVQNSGAGINSDHANPTVTACIFEENDAGMYNYLSSPSVEGCTFAWSYGNGMHNAASSPTVTGSIFEHNSAGLGGGMYNDYDSSPLVVDCTFRDNSASDGGGMFNDGSPTIVHCVLTGNTADYGAGMTNGFRSSVSISGSTICGNSSGQIDGPWIDEGGNVVRETCGPVGDLDGDGAVGSADLAILLGQWGLSGSADLDADGVVGPADLSVLLGNWGA